MVVKLGRALDESYAIMRRRHLVGRYGELGATLHEMPVLRPFVAIYGWVRGW